MEAATIFIPLQSSFVFNPLSGWLNRLQGIQERSEKVYQEKRKVQKGFENCWVPLFESLHHCKIKEMYVFNFLHFVSNYVLEYAIWQYGKDYCDDIDGDDEKDRSQY